MTLHLMQGFQCITFGAFLALCSHIVLGGCVAVVSSLCMSCCAFAPWHEQQQRAQATVANAAAHARPCVAALNSVLPFSPVPTSNTALQGRMHFGAVNNKIATVGYLEPCELHLLAAQVYSDSRAAVGVFSTTRRCALCTDGICPRQEGAAAPRGCSALWGAIVGRQASHVLS